MSLVQMDRSPTHRSKKRPVKPQARFAAIEASKPPRRWSVSWVEADIGQSVAGTQRWPRIPKAERKDFITSLNIETFSDLIT
jgi:hypothetical protein